MHTLNFSECAQACMVYSLACTSCATECINEDQMEMMRECIKRCLECADICHLCAQTEQRKSPFMQEICAMCAKVCEYCAEECSKHQAAHC